MSSSYLVSIPQGLDLFFSSFPQSSRPSKSRREFLGQIAYYAFLLESAETDEGKSSYKWEVAIRVREMSMTRYREAAEFAEWLGMECARYQRSMRPTTFIKRLRGKVTFGPVQRAA